MLATLLCASAISASSVVFAQDATPSPSPASTPDTTSTISHEGNKPPVGEHAGEPGKHMRGGGGGLDMLSKELNLTDDQKAKLKPILEDQRAQMKALHEDTTASREQKMAKMKELREERTAKIEAILTPEQKTKFEEMQSKMRERRGAAGLGGPGGEKSDKGEKSAQ